MMRSLTRKVPYLMLLDAAMIAREHWGYLEPHDRRRLADIIKSSGGRPGNLSARDRSELSRIVRQLDLVTAGRRLMPFNGGVRKSRMQRR